MTKYFLRLAVRAIKQIPFLHRSGRLVARNFPRLYKRYLYLSTPYPHAHDPDYHARLAASCHDGDFIPRVSGAGEVIVENGERIQLMHNGVKVVADGYYGAGMTEIIRRLKGCHEPQEEAVFYHIVERLRKNTPVPQVLELGAYWSYYALWVLHRIPKANAYLVEPDPDNLKIARKNFHLNGREGSFLQAAVGAVSMPSIPFPCADKNIRNIRVEDLPSLFNYFVIENLDCLLSDTQGAETGLLKSGEALFRAGKVRFLVVSTHHHSISQDPFTHQKCLELIRSSGGHIIAEHAVSQSYSGDGLIAASFDERDRDMTVGISYADASESFFGEPGLPFEE